MHPHRKSPLPLLLLFLLSLLPGAARAQQMVLELEPGATEGLVYCDTAHKLLTCQYYHVETASALTVGVQVTLDGRVYVVDWVGPGYYLDTGVVLQPAGEAKASSGDRLWVEVYPRDGKAHTSKVWRDADADGKLSASDALILEDGRTVRVKDVRLHVRVSPAMSPSKD